MADLTPDSFMAGLATEDDLTPDSFMAKAAKPAAEAPSLNPVAEGFRRVGEVLLGTEKRPTALGEMVYPVTATDPAARKDLNAARAPWEAPPILDVSALGGSKALPAGAARGAAQGVEEFASSLTSPVNVMLMGGMGLLKSAPTLARLASGGFSLHMMRGAYEQNQQFQQAVDAGDSEAAARALVGFTGSAAMSAAAAKHGFSTPKERMRVAPDTPAEAEASRAALATNEDLALARVDPAQAGPVVNREIAARQAAGQWDKTLEKTPSPEEARARKEAAKVMVPEEGDPDPILTYQRGNLAAELAGKDYAALTPEERATVDDLAKQGYGMREARVPEARVDGGDTAVPVVPERVGGGVPGDTVERAVSEVRADDAGAAGAPVAERIPRTPEQIMERVTAENEAARQAGLREEAQRILEESTLDAATKPLPDVRIDEAGRVVEPRPQTWQEAQAARRAERTTPEPQPLLDQVAEASPEPSFMRRLDETGREASARLRKRLSSTTSMNEFANPTTVRDLALSILGDVARGSLKLEQVAQRLLDTWGPKAAAVASKVRRELEVILRSGMPKAELAPGKTVYHRKAGLKGVLATGNNGELIVKTPGVSLPKGKREYLQSLDGWEADPLTDSKSRLSSVSAAVATRPERARELRGQREYNRITPDQRQQEVLRTLKQEGFQDREIEDAFRQIHGEDGYTLESLTESVRDSISEARAEANHQQYVRLSAPERVEQGIAKTYDVVDTLGSLVAAELGEKPYKSGLSSSTYFGDGPSKIRISDHQLPPSYATQHGNAALEVHVGDVGKNLDANFNVSETATLQELRQQAKQIAKWYRENTPQEAPEATGPRPVSELRRRTQRGSVTIGPVEPKPEAAPAAPPPEPPKQTAAQAPAAEAGIPVSPSFEKTKGRVLAKLDVSPEVRDAVAGEMAAWEKANPERKKITHAQIIADAKATDPSLLRDMDLKAAQDAALKDPALYHAARQAIPGLMEKSRQLEEQIRTTPRDGNTLELERQRDQIDRDVQKLLGVTLAVRSQHGRNLAMHRIMVDTAGFDPTYWMGRAKKSLGLPADASLPVDVQKEIGAALSEGASAEADALGRVREQGAKRKRAEAAGAPVPKRKRERGADGKPVEPKPPAEEKADTTTPPTPEEKAAVDADAKVQAAKRKLAQKMAKLEKSTLWDAISSIRRAGLLTSPRTAARNTLGNLTMQVLEETSRIPGAVLDSALAVFSGQRAYGGASTTAVARASYAAATKGIQEARQVMRQGATDEQLAQFDIPKELNLGGGKASRVLETYVNGVFRFMSAQDRVFKRYAIERSLQEQMKLAGVDAPTEAMMAQAIADADFATFNNPNKAAQAYSRARAGMPNAAKFGLDLVFPFVRTPANVLARVLDYSGGGLAKAGYAGIKAAADKAMTPEQQRYTSSNFGRGVVGPTLIYVGYQLAAAGLATGSYQADAGKRNTDEAAGRLAGAVKIGDSWQMISPLSPGGALITIGATLQREATGPLKDEAKRPAKVAAVAGRTVLDHPFLQGAKEMADAVSDPGRMGERAAASMAGSFVPTIVSDAASLGDSARRDSRTDGGVIEASGAAIAARTPGLRNTLPERKDVFGRTQPQSASAVVNPGIGSAARETDDPMIRELVRNKVSLSDPQRIAGETLDEYRSRREIIGREIEKWLRREVASSTYARLETEEERRLALDKAETRGRRLANAKLGKKYERATAAERRAMLDQLLKGGQ